MERCSSNYPQRGRSPRRFVVVAMLAALALLVPAQSALAVWGVPVPLNSNAATDGPMDDDYASKVATDGAGNWVAVWDSLNGADVDIFVSRSTDNGATWTPRATLNTDAATDSRTDHSPQVATDGAGNCVAVWVGWDDPGASGWHILVSRSSNNGATWTAPVRLAENVGTTYTNVYEPQVATDGAGNWVAVWVSDDSLGVVPPENNLDYDILVSRSTDNGASWTTAAALHSNALTDSGWDDYPQVATDGAGNWVALWSSDEDIGGIGTDTDILVCCSSDDGATWTDPEALNAYAWTDSRSDYTPQVATNGAGNWVAVWYSRHDIGGVGDDHDILVSRSTDNGANWTAPAALNSNAATDTGDDGYPHVATDRAGEWVAVWRSDENLGGSIGTDRDIFFSRSSDNGATWTPLAVLNTNAATDSGSDYEPQVTTDGAGNWVVVWNSYDDLGGTIGTDADILVATGTPTAEVPVGGVIGLVLIAAAAAGTGVLAIRRRK